MTHSSRRGFTLIELLVVIAIIAILAAILFPVFAQAREKARQTVALSNQKQLGLAILQYEQDYDECGPIATEKLGGTYNMGNNILNIYTSPPDLRPPATQARMIFWANSIQPYEKSYGVYNDPSTQEEAINVASAKSHPEDFSITYNGDLQSLPQAGVTAPADVIMLWNGLTKCAYTGYAYANPQLTCTDDNSPCVYQPQSGGSCSSGNGGTDSLVVFSGQPTYSVWVHGEGDNQTYADGHAKWVSRHGDYHVDPWVGEDSSGSILSAGGTYSYEYDGCHAYLFAPDHVD